MNLFAQMIDYVRAQQMYSNLICILNNKFNNITFLATNYIVSDGFINNEKETNQHMEDNFKTNLFKSFIIHDKPNINEYLKNYYDGNVKFNNSFETRNKSIINYDKYVEMVN